MIGGVYAAVLTPRVATGELDEAAFRGLLDFLLSKGIGGFAVNGATGEFCLTTEAEFARLVAVTAETVRGRGNFLAGIGSAGADASIRLGRVAAKAGAAGLLLPMPYFFPYSQEDLKAFSRTVAAGVDAPVLLYNLPQFTSGLDPKTSVELIEECANIVGIKDSSGSLKTVRRLTERKIAARRLIGNDSVLTPALQQRLLDGVVSGIACVLPELIVNLYRAGSSDSRSGQLLELAQILAELTNQLDALPTPWALKVLAEARGLVPATYPMPLSGERERQRAELLAWFEEHRARLLAQ
ncbi:MAG TPA: dihydrodipicolinate synthase family protein [Acidobacteriaceae bacterium]